MRSRFFGMVLAIVGVASVMGSQAVAAQTATTGAIAGVARDSTGAVLPGVTVEAASPALIEKARVAVTDSQGNYKIIDLRPGTYSVTFALPGFSTFRREGIELSAGFTASANAEMTVGELEETVTVTGASPIVDVQGTRGQTVLRSETLDLLPSGAKNVSGFAALTLGAMPSASGRNDVGGDKSEQSTGIVLHGGRGDDGRLNWDGMNTNTWFGGAGGGQRTYLYNTVAAQEVVIDTAGVTAEGDTGGAHINIVPKEGSDRFSVYGTANYTGSTFSEDSVPDRLKARGANDQSSLKVVYDFGAGVGGPIKRGKLWFYTTHRAWGAQNFGANNFFNKSTNPLRYEPDLTRPAYADMFFADSSFRATMQVTAKHKLAHEFHLQNGCQCWLQIGGGIRRAPEATPDFSYGPQILNQTTWSFTATNRLLIQAGVTLLRQEFNTVNGTALNANKFTASGKLLVPGPNAIPILEQSTGYSYGGMPLWHQNFSEITGSNYNEQVSVAYVTGSHAFKTGVQLIHGPYDQVPRDDVASPPVDSYTFLNGSPVLLSQLASPFLSLNRYRGLGLFVQDQWTVRRLTLTLGARFDHFHGRALAMDIPAGKYVQPRHVPEFDGIPDFKDVTLRGGAAYDLFGNGKTAIKGTFGKYLMGQGSSLVQQGYSPGVAIVQTVTRTWSDGDGDFVPDCELTNLRENGECGTVNNLAFGQPFSNQRLADDARTGWGHREYNYQTSLQLQHELWPGVGLAVGYFRTWWRNQVVTQNVLTAPTDYTEYCITAPADPRLGPNSGRRICGFYDVNPNKRGQVDLVRTLAKNFGMPEEVFNGFEVSFNARWRQGALAMGGISLGRQVYDYCYANGHPELTPQGFPASYPRNADYCRVTPSWWDGIGSQIKLQAVYPLPYDISVSGTYKHLPGIPISAIQVLRNAEIAPALGRDLTACPATGTCTATQSHSLVPIGGGAGSTLSGTLFDERLNQTDLRFSKTFRVGRGRIQGNFDIYNIFNARTPQANTETIGSAFLRPSLLLGGRLFKFGAQVDW